MKYDLQHIEAYWLGKMPLEEVQKFEAFLETDADFKTEVAGYEPLFLGLEGLKLQEKVKNWSVENAEKKSDLEAQPKVATVRRFSLRRNLVIAASVAMILILGYVFGISTYSDQSLYENSYDNTSTFEGIRGETEVNSLEEGFNLYKNKDFEKAASFFGSIPNDDKNKSTANYYLAHTLMQQEKFQEALPPLGDLKNDARYAEEAEWLQILCWLRTKNEVELQKGLNNIVQKENSFNYKKAKELKQKLGAFQRKLIF